MGTEPEILREEIGRYRCLGDDETPLVVVAYRLIEMTGEAGRRRRRPGARWVELATGEPLRTVDARTFELVATGEIIRRVD
jgi:hypothetical protein